MANWIQRAVAGLAALTLVFPNATLLPAQDASNPPSSQQDNFVFKANAELVLTNVVVRDAKTGEFVRGLKSSDFTILEERKKAADLRRSIFSRWIWQRRS